MEREDDRMGKLLYHWKLRSKMLLLFILIIMMCSGMILSITTALHTYFIRDRTEDMYSASLELVSSNVENYFDRLKSSVYTISYSSSANQFLNSIPEKSTSKYAQSKRQWLSSLKSLENLHLNTKMLFCSELHDMVYHNFDTGYNYAYDYREETWYGFMSRSDGPDILVINNPQNYLSSPQPDTTYAVIYKITNWGAQDNVGYMLVQLDRSVLEDLTLSGNVICENTLIYDRSAGAVIYDSKPDSSRWKNTLQKIEQNPSASTAFLNTTIEGEEAITAYSVLPDLNWTFVFSSSYDSLLSGTSVLLAAGVMVTLFILMVSIVSVIYFTSRITKPLEEVNKDIELMKQNNFQFQLPVLSGDEIGRLSENFNLMAERMDFLINKSEKAALLLKQAELDSLQQQVNPHFLYNTLEMIMGLASENRSEDVIETCGQLGRIFKFSLSSQDVIPVRDELLHVKNYLAIIQRRFENKFQVIQEIDPKALDCRVIKFIIQPFVENAVLHGFQNLVSGGVLRIALSREETPLGEPVLRIAVEDNGDGIPDQVIREIYASIASFQPTGESALSLNTHIGILNVCYRLKLYFGDQFSISIEPRHPGTGIYLQVPCILQKDVAPPPPA